MKRHLTSCCTHHPITNYAIPTKKLLSWSLSPQYLISFKHRILSSTSFQSLLSHQVLVQPTRTSPMNSSLNFIVSTSHSRLSTRSSRTSTTFVSTKRRRHGPTYACLESPRRRPTSIPPVDDPNPRASLREPSSPQPDGLDPPIQTPAPSVSRNLPTEGTKTSGNGVVQDDATRALNSTPPVAVTENPSVPIGVGPLSFAIPTRWLLYSVPFLWGSFGPSVRLLFAQEPHQDASVFNTERLLLSTLVYVPILFAEFQAFLTGKRKQESDEEEGPFAFFPAGVELGVYVFLANVAQVIGLQQTSASRAAFLVQLQTVIVPVLSGIFGIDKISAKTWISSAVAVAGVALLSSDKGHGTVASLTGDSLEVLSALFFSTYIIRLGNYCNKLPANPLVATKIATQAVLSIGWAFAAELGNIFNHMPSEVSSATEAVPWNLTSIGISIGVVAWTGLMTSAVSGWAQTKGQQGVPASEAVVIFATQPLWASALAAVVLGESFGPRGIVGGAFIIAATILSSRSKKEPENKT